MSNRWLFVLAGVGLLLGIGAVWFFSIRHPPQPPAFNPAANPYGQGIFANGIIESAQASGQNVNIFPEVSGPVTRILVAEGQKVTAGTPLLTIDTSVQEAATAQLKAQAEAARTQLDQLRHEPRPETLRVAEAQVEAATASLRLVRDQLEKLRAALAINPRAVSKEALDTATNTVRVNEANLVVAQRQYELTRAGAWSFEIQSQERTAQALEKQYEASSALLQKYTVRAPVNGTILAVQAARGAYVSPSGAYDSYTQGAKPVAVLSTDQQYLGVRVYVDEILIGRLPAAGHITAEMQVRGTDLKVPLEFVRIQPYVTPKIALSDERQERVDLRVLPVLFRFAVTDTLKVFPGQLVDVYIRTK
ncbi:MAG TPA: biotin/lipoyl-binding protein [Steroidobacteraceae bacterium]|nr:biotin/lipoyl-binding protein [Steroidobacteraceae bacterium]